MALNGVDNMKALLIKGDYEVLEEIKEYLDTDMSVDLVDITIEYTEVAE